MSWLNFSQPRCRSFRRSTITELPQRRPPKTLARLAVRRELSFCSSIWMIDPERKKIVPSARQAYRMNRYFSCLRSSLMTDLFLRTMNRTLSSQAREQKKAATRYISPLLKEGQVYALQMFSTLPMMAKEKTMKLHMGIYSIAYSATSEVIMSSEEAMRRNWQRGKKSLSWPRGRVQKVARVKVKVASEKEKRWMRENTLVWVFRCFISIIQQSENLYQLPIPRLLLRFSLTHRSALIRDKFAIF